MTQVDASRTRLMINAERDCEGDASQAVLVGKPARDAPEQHLA